MIKEGHGAPSPQVAKKVLRLFAPARVFFDGTDVVPYPNAHAL